MKNPEWCRYTYLHRKAFEYCVRKLIRDPGLRDEMLRRARVHDMDKMVMYLFMEQKDAQQRHIETQAHHLENDLPRTYYDLVETVIDYECAPYTKPDKPLNAYDFVLLLVKLKVLDEETGNILTDIMAELGIDHTGTVSEDTEGREYIDSFGEVSEEEIFKEILSYVNGLPQSELNKLIGK